MENQPTKPPLIHVERLPEGRFDVLAINLPVPRLGLSSAAAEHFKAAGRETMLAFQALFRELRRSRPVQPRTTGAEPGSAAERRDPYEAMGTEC